MTTTNHVESNPWVELAKDLKAKRDAYKRAGFTHEEAMRLIEAELTHRPSDPEPRQLFPQPLQIPAWPQPPYHVTCELTPVVEALVIKAGGYSEDATGRQTIGGTVIPCG